MIILGRCSPLRQFLRRCHRQGKFEYQKTSKIFSLLSAVESSQDGKNHLTAFFGKWPQEEQQEFRLHMRIITDFISESEEKQLHEEIEPYMSRLRYEFDHWDDVSVSNHK